MATENIFDGGLREFLLEADDLTARVGPRIHRKKLPEGSPMPAVVISVISSVTGHDLAGRSGLDRHRVQIDCYAKTQGEASKVARAVLDALDCFDGPMEPSTRVVALHLSTQELEDQETKLHRALMDWRLSEHVP